ncbi:hypothetical protein EST38_g9632 [Candolleomyces aberdarensis]|uniref:Uncharacterized protein n=1 Tax=Candolleomyces aberdarensis TaxID=2316362 RepID=A0A4Q2DCC7_9AGAR|nr:hypothetical protein EST38_g9632 [Candolleomyces aberdarensis]
MVHLTNSFQKARDRAAYSLNLFTLTEHRIQSPSDFQNLESRVSYDLDYLTKFIERGDFEYALKCLRNAGAMVLSAEGFISASTQPTSSWRLTWADKEELKECWRALGLKVTRHAVEVCERARHAPDQAVSPSEDVSADAMRVAAMEVAEDICFSYVRLGHPNGSVLKSCPPRPWTMDMLDAILQWLKELEESLKVLKERETVTLQSYVYYGGFRDNSPASGSGYGVPARAMGLIRVDDDH